MDDISAKLNEILSDPQSMQQIQNIMGSLGMNQDQNSGNNASPQTSGTGSMPDLSTLSGLLGSMGGAGQNQNGEAPSSGTGGMPDLSVLSSLLGSMGRTGQNQNGGTPSSGTGGMPDLSALSGLLGSMGGTGQNQNGGAPASGTGSMPDLSALGGLLGSMGGNTAPAAAPPVQGASDAANTAQMVAAISRIAPMLRKVNEEDDSTRFLRALRPLLGEARRRKLDESIKMMQMMRMLPLLKGSGVLSGLLG